MAETPAIEGSGLTKVYGPTVALADASLIVQRGEIHGLLGENGAGKSTLVRILAGVESPDAGEVRFFGKEAAGGVVGREKVAAFIHQDLALFREMSVADNIALVGGFDRKLGLIDESGTGAVAEDLIGRLGMRLDPKDTVGELTLADQTAVAVAKALSTGARVIVLDEPTAYLEAREARRLFALLAKLREEDVACLIITHRSADVLASCDALTVLRNGRTVATRRTSGISESGLIELITGHSPSAAEQRAVGPVEKRKAVLSCSELSGAGFHDVTLEIAAGEAVALCGLADSGHFAVGEALFTASYRSGSVTLDDRMMPKTVAQAIRAGVSFLPRDRRSEGLAAELTARENIYLNPEARWYRPIRSGRERAQAKQLMTQLVVRPPDPDRVVATLSGGNQQKVLLAKAVKRDPRLLILNEPTAGVDVGAKAEIQRELLKLRSAASMATLVITSDFDEVAEISDRAIIMRHGHVIGSVSGSDLSASRLTELAYGGKL
jgi:ribose transport system ATP-binding protein